MHFTMSRTYLSCRTRSRTCHTDAQYGISPQIALILGPIQPSHHGIDAFKFSSYVKFILNQSRAYDRLDIANGSVNPQAVVGGLVAVSELDCFVVALGRSGRHNRPK